MHVCTLAEPRPSMLGHLAPRNVLPSLHVIENGSCDLIDLNRVRFFLVLFYKKIENSKSRNYKYNYFATRSMTFCGASHLY